MVWLPFYEVLSFSPSHRNIVLECLRFVMHHVDLVLNVEDAFAFHASYEKTTDALMRMT